MFPEIGVIFRREQHPASLADYARRVEAMGFNQLWVVEDCFYMGGIAQAAIALTATTRLTVGVGINPAVVRNPAFLAMDYATLASAFPGRLIGGIGHGFGGWMEQVGAKPASWLQSIEEVTTAVWRMLGGEEVTVHGDYVNLDAVQLASPPEVAPPILLGVQAEKSLRLAGACADGVLLAEGAGPAYVRWARGLLAQGRSDAGREGIGSVVVYANCLIDDDNPQAARARVREITAESVGGFMQPQFAHAACGPALIDVVTREGADALRDAMPDAWLHELAITGTTSDAVAAIGRLADVGADVVVLVPPVGSDGDAWLNSPEMARIASLARR
ncbi:MAG: LLM class flavin-dependent oxidoreductase [Thermomicrobiales bacterium]